MKLGYDWIVDDVAVKYAKTPDGAALAVISGDFEGTTLDITPSPISDSSTNITADLNLMRSWYMDLLTSFVSDDNLIYMLDTSLDGLAKYSKNPVPPSEIIKDEKTCFFIFCF